MIKILILSITLSLFTVSCNKSKEEVNKNSDTNIKTTSGEKNIKKKVHKLDAKLIKDEFYEVKFGFQEELSSKDELKFTINAIPKKDRHINDGFPVSLKIEDSCFKFEKKKFKGKDAKIFNEKSLAFELKSSCKTQGKHNLKGNLRFGYCTDEMCYTHDSPFQFNINIK